MKKLAFALAFLVAGSLFADVGWTTTQYKPYDSSANFVYAPAENRLNANDTNDPEVTDGDIFTTRSTEGRFCNNITYEYDFGSAKNLSEIRIYTSHTSRDDISVASVQVKYSGASDWATLANSGLAYEQKDLASEPYGRVDNDYFKKINACRYDLFCNSDGTAVASGITAVKINFGDMDGNDAYIYEIELVGVDGEGGESGGDDEDDDDDSVQICTLTIPAQTGLTVSSVTTNGTAVAASGNTYSVVSNTTVTINFTAASGYEITAGNPVTVTVSGDMTLTTFPTVSQTSGGGDTPGTDDEETVTPNANGEAEMTDAPDTDTAETAANIFIVASEADKTGVFANATVASGETAAATIQSVINGASSGDIIAVKAGTYLINTELSFAKATSDGVTFRSDDGSGSARARDTTFLVGAGSNRIIKLAAYNATVAGFTITNGYASAERGGGVYMDNPGNSTVLRNCVITNCKAWKDAYSSSEPSWVNGEGSGGGVFLYCSGTVSGCIIKYCSAARGAGVGAFESATDYVPERTGDPVISGCVIRNNTLIGCGPGNEGGGSAIWCCRDLVIENTEIAQNTCATTGSLAYNITIKSFQGYLLLDGCYIHGNGFSNAAADCAYDAWGMKLKDCRIVNEKGCRYLTRVGDFKSVERCSFLNCSATEALVTEATNFVNCVFAWNALTNSSGSVTGGLFTDAGKDYLVDNCTFVGNTAVYYSTQSTADAAVFNNSVFMGNGAIAEGSVKTTSFTFDHCCIQTSQATTTGWAAWNIVDSITTNSTITSMGFTDASSNDFRIARHSPLVNAGKTLPWMTVTSTDVAGSPRRCDANGYEDETAAPDIGAYEYCLAASDIENRGEPVVLTIPANDDMTVDWVKCDDEKVAVNDDGTYTVKIGSTVKVKFVANDGYTLSRSKISFMMGEEAFTFPDSMRPSVFTTEEVRSLIRINEILASNSETLTTANGGIGLDWIEIKNSASVAFDLGDWYLYDDSSKKKSKWEEIKGSAIIPAGGYMIVWCDKDYANFAEDEAHSEIALTTDGETPFLANPNGEIIDEVAFPRQIKDISWGRVADGDTTGYFETPTPGAANGSEGRTGFTPAVTLSEPHGYKTESFQLTMSCESEPTADIYYTTDGSSPTVNSTKYTGPITISKTTVIRAAVPDGESILQSDASATYIFLEDVFTSRSYDGPTGFPSNEAVNDQKMRYGMLDYILNDSSNTQMLRDAFTNSIRTVSLVIDPEYLFGATTGIYVNARQDGSDWERQFMLESFNPQDPDDEFTAPAGLRIRGATSRFPAFAKHSFHVIFRSRYGMGSLKHELFGEEGSDSFGRIDFRCSQNNSFHTGYSTDALIGEVFSRDTQRDMGQPCTRSRFYNLFINGVYWGVYQTEERMCAEYAADYYGATEQDYDVLRTGILTGNDGTQYHTQLKEGTADAANAFWSMVTDQGFSGDYASNYNRARGLNDDGTRNPSRPVYLNETNLITHMIVAHYTADTDSPANGMGMANNIQAFRCRTDGLGKLDGFIFNRHDAEQSLGYLSSYDSDTTGNGVDRMVTWSEPLMSFNPATINGKLMANAEYRMKFVDQVYEHCLRPGGLLTVEKATERFAARKAELGTAPLAEMARWFEAVDDGGISKTTTPTFATWEESCGIGFNFITNRMPYLIAAYRNRGWYPTVDAPVVTNAASERVLDDYLGTRDEVLTISSDLGTVYCTTDGSDPRAEGGAVSASATAMSSFTVGETDVVLKMRALTADGEWSALETVTIKGDPIDLFTGVYNEPVTLSLDDKYVFSNATLNAGLFIADGVTAKLNAATNTENFISSISAAGAEVRFTGDGTIKLEGADTLAVVSNLVVKSGTLTVKSTGVSATKTPVINVLGFVEQTGGVIDLDIDVDTTNQIYGIYVANKDLKDANDKNLGVIYALFDGGEFNAVVGATKSSAVYINKGSVDTTFKGGEVVTATLKGTEPRFVSAAGDLYLKKVTATVGMPEAYSTITAARVFKSDKDISITDGHYIVNVPGPGAEVFSSADTITIDDGTFELVADDDSFSALNRIKVNGGLFYAVSLSNDVFDSNGDMEINGGTILAYTTADGHEAFDVDPEETEEGENAHQLRINGGTIFATGGKSADWPDNVSILSGLNVFSGEDLTASTYSAQYLSLATELGTVYTAKLPTFSDSKCAILATAPGLTGTPTLSASAPSEGSQDFHDYYITAEVATNQDQLRFLEIYGSTNDGADGDTGEYIVLTNISDKVVTLTGLKINLEKAKDWTKSGESASKCLVTLTSGTVAAKGSIRLDQADYTDAGWTKITNGDLYIALTDSGANTVQSGSVSFDNELYPDVDGLGAALVAIKFETVMENTTEYWKSSTASEEPDTGLTDWPTDPDTEITDTMTAADLGITTGSFTDATPAELRKLSKWATANSIAFSGTEKNSFSFDENGNPLNDITKAYLLNCAVDALTTKEPEFKFTSITPGVQPTIEGTFNGTVNYHGKVNLSDTGWSTADASAHHFFRATLTR